MKPRLYVETTIFSYLAARPSRDVIAAGRQQVTLQWWSHRHKYELFTSEAVLGELAEGDPDAAAARLALAAELPLLDATDEANEFGDLLTGPGLIPKRASQDATHLAIATVHRMDFLLTWNCRHLANAQIARAAYNVLTGRGATPPHICTPDELEGIVHDLR